MNPQAFHFRHASAEDIPSLLALYRSLVGTPGCAWNDAYPGRENILEDLARQALYCLCAPDGTIVAAASAGQDDELQGLCWSPEIQSFCDLSRVAVRPELQNQGLGGLLLRHVMQDARQRGFDGMRMLVSSGNPAAVALYEKAAFSRCGQVERYGIDFYCYERKL